MKGKIAGWVVKREGAVSVLLTVDSGHCSFAVRIAGLTHPEVGDGVSFDADKVVWAYGEAKRVNRLESHGKDDMSALDVLAFLKTLT
jgi:hypothetical protein